MTELNTEPLSTVIDNDAPAPGSAEFRPDAPASEPVEPEKPMSLEDAVKQAAAETKESADKEPKPKVEPKEAKPEAKVEPKPEKVAPERGDNGKFTAKPKAELDPEAGDPAEGAEVEQERGEPRPSEGRDINRAPARFLPRAQEAWPTVHQDVRAEVYRTIDNMQKGIDEGAAAVEYQKELREFDELARASKTTLKDAIAGYVSIDKQLAVDLPGAIQRILATQGITPQQYAQHVMGQEQQRQQNPQAYAQSQEAAQLKNENQRLQAELQQTAKRLEEEASQRNIQQVEQTLFAEVRKDHPRFDELRPIVLKVWNSDLLPSDINERDRLYAAVDYAERISPVGINAQREPLNPAPNAQRPLNPAGTRSVKGSLSYGAEVPRKSAKVSLDEAIKMAARSVNG